MRVPINDDADRRRAVATALWNDELRVIWLAESIEPQTDGQIGAALLMAPVVGDKLPEELHRLADRLTEMREAEG